VLRIAFGRDLLLAGMLLKLFCKLIKQVTRLMLRLKFINAVFMVTMAFKVDELVVLCVLVIDSLHFKVVDRGEPLVSVDC